MTEPTDAAIDTLILEHGVMAQAWPTQRQLHAFARAVLAKWGTPPAGAGEPVAWLDPWTGTKVTTDYDAYGKHGIPLYTAPQPTQLQAGAVPLTDEQIHAIYDEVARKEPYAGAVTRRSIVRAIEAAHGTCGRQRACEKLNDNNL